MRRSHSVLGGDPGGVRTTTWAICARTNARTASGSQPIDHTSTEWTGTGAVLLRYPKDG